MKFLLTLFALVVTFAVVVALSSAFNFSPILFFLTSLSAGCILGLIIS